VFIIETKHYAHLPICPCEGISEIGSERDRLDCAVKNILAQFKPEMVSLNDDFCSNFLSEIGLVGGDLDSVRKAAEEIKQIVDDSESFEFYTP